MAGGLILGADIGGTNANLGIVDSASWRILYQECLSTKETDDFPKLINGFLERAKEKLGRAPSIGGFAVAGPVLGNPGKRKVQLTNASLKIDEATLIKRTPLKFITIMNDFAAIGHAINILKPSQFRTLRKGKPQKNGTRAVLGPGTGLGKAILYHDAHDQRYIPLPSEGSAADLPVYKSDDPQLIAHVKNSGPVTQNQIVSGSGLELIYGYLREMESPRMPDRDAHGIGGTRETDPDSRRTFAIFGKYLARCCKNFALNTLSTGGLYIAGGIIAKHHDALGKEFLKEFDLHHDIKFRRLLKRIPIRIIIDYDISIQGAAYGATKER